MKAQRPLLDISSRWQVKHKIPKSTCWDTSTLNCQVENTRGRSPRPSQGQCKTRMRDKTTKPLQEVLWSKMCSQPKRQMQQMWRFYPLRRFPMPCKEKSVQKLPQIWALHQLVLHESPAKTSIPQALQTKGTSADCRYYTSIWQLVRIRKLRKLLLSPVAD